MIPVIAARIVPITVTARANEPGTRRNNTCTQYNRSFAIPLRSSITPMKTKAGTATSTKFSAAVPQMRGTKLKNSISAKISRK